MGLMKEQLAGADILSGAIHFAAAAAHSGHDLLAVASKFLCGCTIASALPCHFLGLRQMQISLPL